MYKPHDRWEAAAALLTQEGLTPLLDTQGRALAVIWICDFVKANLGAHHELQISLFATPVAGAKLPAHPFAFFRRPGEPAGSSHGLPRPVERYAARRSLQ